MSKRVRNSKGTLGRSPKHNRWVRAAERSRWVKNQMLIEREAKKVKAEEKSKMLQTLEKIFGGGK